VYDAIGGRYNRHRAADDRILCWIKRLLNLAPGAVIADIGAGTGNYSNALADCGYRVHAVEPSEKMSRQATPHPQVTWVEGFAESIPLPDNSIDGIIVVLAHHHFSSLNRAASEMHRICPKGPMVIFTLDPREGDEPWFKDYFPDIYRQDYITFKPIGTVSETLAGESRRSITIEPFPLPHDLADQNMYSAWRDPEKYLDAQFRQNTSGFALAPEASVQTCINKLKDDLETGKWDQKYGKIRKEKFFNVGFTFLRCAYPKSPAA
jgi:ubiquinone/menaquinone biosynthesis C-methylase UbiE